MIQQALTYTLKPGQALLLVVPPAGDDGAKVELIGRAVDGLGVVEDVAAVAVAEGFSLEVGGDGTVRLVAGASAFRVP